MLSSLTSYNKVELEEFGLKIESTHRILSMYVLERERVKGCVAPGCSESNQKGKSWSEEPSKREREIVSDKHNLWPGKSENAKRALNRQ